jgi:inner membrane protein
MLFRSHILLSLVIYFVLNYFVEMPFFVLGFVLFGAAFVDIDSGMSRVGKSLFFRPLQFMTRHRGFFHSLVACVIFSLIIGVISRWGGFGFFVGYLSHLVLDCFTPAGVGLFWPFGFRVRGFIRSGSWVEDVVFVLFLFLSVILGYLFLRI